jgi:peptide/nickel transport system substrate-binding protein
MENRFGLKDLLVVVLLVAVIGVVLLAMWQYDRQLTVLQRIESSLSKQAEEMAELNRTASRGGFAAAGANNPGGPLAAGGIEQSPKGNPFYLVDEAAKKPDFARGDWLVENFGVKFARLTPLGTMADLYGSYVRARVLECLAYRDPNTLEYLPSLARDWQVKENVGPWRAYVDKRMKDPLTEADVLKEKECPPADKADQRKAYVEKRMKEGRRESDVYNEPDCPPAIEVTFQLRHGVTWSDGQPFTAADVVFTFDWTMNPKVEAPRERAYLEKIRSVEKKGDYEVVFKFREPYYEYFDLASGIELMPRHFYESIGPEQFNQKPGLLMGTGAYKLPDPRSWTPGTALELVRNDTYWGPRATFEKLVFREVEGETPEIILYRNGQVDRIGCTPDQYRELLKDQAVVNRSQHYEYNSPDSGYTFIGWNLLRGGKPTIFADKRVRQAMTLLLDRQRMAQELFLGYAQVSAGPFFSGGKQADPAIKPWPFDPDRGKALLKEAGWEDRNGDGVLENKDGTPFRFKFTYSAKLDLSKRMALFVKDAYARVGIAVEPEPTDWTIMLKKLDNRDFDAITLGWGGSIESDLFQIFHSSQVKDAGDNFINYKNPELDKLIEQARTTIDENKRNPLWHECQRILHEDQPYTFLLERKSLVFLDKRIQNVKPSKVGLNYNMRMNMPIPWYVPKAQQKWGKQP